jgi:predicted DNA-binding transcriptional regulator AlpA
MTDEENQKKMDEDEWIKTASRAADNLGRGLGVFFRIPVSGVIQAVRPWLPHAQPTRTSAYKKLADSASGKKHDKALRMFEILKEMGASKSHLYSSIKNREKRGDIDSGEADWLKNEVNLYY